MLRNKSRCSAPLVDPAMFIHLYNDHATIEAEIAANAVFESWRTHGKRTGDVDGDFFSMLGAVYEAGRLQGIREERMKKSLARAVGSKSARD